MYLPIKQECVYTQVIFISIIIGILLQILFLNFIKKKKIVTKYFINFKIIGIWTIYLHKILYYINKFLNSIKILTLNIFDIINWDFTLSIFVNNWHMSQLKSRTCSIFKIEEINKFKIPINVIKRNLNILKIIYLYRLYK